ncbi:MAG: FtsX-like permease family protein [Treponema sp.]|jgi:ABC-type lipoprotein release transport system permease subunit|nr:FtsX-like permease family protein [Treponema sp.]
MNWLMVFRGLVKNRNSNIVLLLLIALITFLFFVGNSFLGRADIKLREIYVDSLTADVVLEKTEDYTMNLFGANTPIIDEFFIMPSLPAYDLVMDLVEQEPGIDGISSQVSSSAVLDLGGYREPVLICGVDPESYFSLFPALILDEGEPLKDGEYGAMISAERARHIEEAAGKRPVIGDPLLFTAGGEAGFKIREVPLRGIYHYRNSGQFMDEIVITDPQTARVLSSIRVAGAEVLTGEETTDLLGADMGTLFNGTDQTDSPLDETGEGFSADSLRSFLTASQEKPDGELSGGDWSFILIRLKKGISAPSFIAGLNKKLESFGVTAVGWREAAGLSAIMLLLVQALFNGGIVLVSIAGIMVAVNILLIAVFRRTREIGTLRAIGASDAYIRCLILGENGILALLAGIAGVLGGALLFKLLDRVDIVIPNELIASLLGGPVLRLEFLPGTAALSLAAAVILGLAASLYPVETAVQIDPITAVRGG